MTRAPIRSRIAQLAVLLLGFLLIPNCVSFSRPAKTTVSGRAMHGNMAITRTGCDSPTVTEGHEQFGVLLEARYEASGGFVFGGSAGAVHGTLVAAGPNVPIELVGQSYGMGGVGAYVGYDFVHVGHEAGLSVIMSSGEPSFAPFYRVKLGRLDMFWFEAQYGLAHMLDGRGFTLGINYINSRIELSAHLGSMTRFLVNPVNGDTGLAGSSSVGVMGSASIRIAGDLWLDLGVEWRPEEVALYQFGASYAFQ